MLSAERVRSGLGASRFDDIRLLAEVDSTNRVVRAAADGGAGEGMVVIADHQTAGRGRLDRTWEAPAGSAILMSVLLRPGLPATDLHLVTAAVALAARAACSSVGGVLPDLKWPNDLMVGEAKLAGILAEATLPTSEAGSAVVVGLGLNVSSCPPGAVFLQAVGQGPVDPSALVADLLGDLDRRMGRWDQVIGDYRAACATIGRRVRVVTPGGEMVGHADAVDDHGRLVVTSEDAARHVLAAGDVIHLRSSNPPTDRASGQEGRSTQ